MKRVETNIWSWIKVSEFNLTSWLTDTRTSVVISQDLYFVIDFAFKCISCYMKFLFVLFWAWNFFNTKNDPQGYCTFCCKRICFPVLTQFLVIIIKNRWHYPFLYALRLSLSLSVVTGIELLRENSFHFSSQPSFKKLFRNPFKMFLV